MALELPVDLVSTDSPSNAHRAMLALLHSVVWQRRAGVRKSCLVLSRLFKTM